MRRELIGWAWIVAAVPLALMVVVGARFYFVPRWADTASPVECVVLLASSVLTGLWILFRVLAGWRRGSYKFLRIEVVAATLFAALDVLVPICLVTLLWLLIRSLRNHPLTF